MKNFFLPLFLLLLPFALFAQREAAPQDSTLMKQLDIDDVVVTSDRQVRSLRSVPVITQVVRKDEIQNLNPRSMLDVIQFVLPGIEYSLHGGAQERMTIQGMSSDYVLFLVDGERITNEGNNTVDLNRIDPNNIERIEMVRGSASSLYGSNAIGGVINIITRSAKRPVEATYTGLYDSYHVQRHNLFVGVKQKGWQSATTGGWSFQDAYGLRNAGGDVLDTTVVPGNEIWNVSQKLGYTLPSGRWKIEANGTYNNREQFAANPSNYNHYVFYKMGGNTQYRFNEAYNLDLTYNYDAYTRDLVVEDGPNKGRAPVHDYRTHTSRVQLNAKPWGEELPFFNLGFESINERSRGDKFRDIHKYRSAATYTGYLQSEWRALEKLTLTAGVRYDQHSKFKGYATPRLAVMWREKYFSLRGSFSMGFRSPTLKELFMEWNHQGMFIIQGSEKLQPETSRMFALSPEFTLGKLNFNMTGYYNQFENRIDTRSVQENGKNYLRYMNLSGATWITGLQTVLTYHVLNGLDFRLNHSFVYDVVEEKDKDGKVYDLSQVRPHTGSAAVNYRFTLRKDYTLGGDLSGRFNGPLHAAFVKSQADNTYEYQDYPAYYTLRAGLSASWKRYATLTFGCENLLNYVAEQVSVVTSLSPGRSFYVSLALRY